MSKQLWLFLGAITGIVLFILFAFRACLSLVPGCLYKECGINENKCVLVSQTDSHGGFHGDGTYAAIYDCSENKEYVLGIVDKWNKLPLTENLELIMYGGEKDGESYAYNLADDAGFPEVSNGYYFFCDRHSESVNRDSDEDLFNRYSFNFSIAIYDTDNDILYYIREDT